MKGETETLRITCACPQCNFTLHWDGALGGHTVCPECLTHYRIQQGVGVFISAPKYIDPKTRRPFEGT